MFTLKILGKVRHPYSYTLELLKISIDRLPPGFSADSKKYFEDRLKDFSKRTDCSYEELQQAIVELGQQSWPYRKAYEKLYEIYGRSSEEAFLLENLDKGLRERYEKFIHEGGKLNHIAGAKNADDLWKASPFERFFTPEEKFAIEQALLSARLAARREILELVNDSKRQEYENLAIEFVRRQAVMRDKLGELRSLASVSPKWETEIMLQVRAFEEGWSVVERQIDEQELDKLLEYWKGTLEAFLAA